MMSMGITLKQLTADSRFLAEYEKLKTILLSQERHSSDNAYQHSEMVRASAIRLARLNGRTEGEVAFLDALAMAHDIGKAGDRSQHAEESMRIVQDCGVDDPVFLSYIRFHDIALSWHNSHMRGETPSEKAWRRLASKVDMAVFCIFMAADRSDKTGGWRANPPVVWFFGEARRRGLIAESMAFETEEHSANRGGVP